MSASSSMILRVIFCLLAAFPSYGAQPKQNAAPTPPTAASPSGKKSTGAPSPTIPKNVAGPGAASDQKGVVAQYSEAQKLFNAGQFNEALIAFDRIVKRYPSHEPSIIQYAKTLYRLDRIPESYNLFARINPQYLDPETSYEYGYASYVNKRWDGALFAFKRVPPDHALYDLANYYGALSAIKLRRYSDAEDMLDKAVVLPDKLSKSRGLYQKHIQSLKHLQEKAELDQLAATERARLNRKKSGPVGPTAATPGAPKPDPKAYKHNGFLLVDRLAKLKVSQEHQTIDKHGYSRTTYDRQIGSFTFWHGPLYPLPIQKFGDNSSAVGLQLELGIDDTNTKGRLERVVVYEDSEDTPRALEDDLPATHVTIGRIGGTPWLEFALPNSWWIGASASLSFQYPEFKRGQRTSKRSGSPHVGKQFSFGPHTGFVLGTFYYEQLTDSETEPLIDTATSILNGTIKFSSDTVVELIASNSQFNYQLPTIVGPDAVTAGSLAVYQSFPLGIILSAKGVMASIENNIVRDLPSVDAASADGITTAGSFQLETTPVSWLTLFAKYGVSQTKWSVHQEDRKEVFEKNVPDFVDQTTFSASINFLF